MNPPNITGRKLDGGTNTLLSTVISEAEESYIADPADPDWQALKMVSRSSQGGDFDDRSPAKQRSADRPATPLTEEYTETTRLVRVLARSGPKHQTGFVRVNELEVYAL